VAHQGQPGRRARLGDHRHVYGKPPALLIELLVFDATTAASLGEVHLLNDGLPNPGPAVSPDSSRAYVTFDSQTIVVYDVPSETDIFTWSTTRALTRTATGTLTLSADGKTLYAAGQVLTAIDTAAGNVLGTVLPPGAPRLYSFVGSAASADGATLHVSCASQIGTGAPIVPGGVDGCAAG